jgi:hypothetical protein
MKAHLVRIAALLVLMVPGASAQDPVVSFEMEPAAPWAGDVVTLTSTATAQGVITNWTWDFDDGTFGYGETVEHVFQAGSYNIGLTVVDDQGRSATYVSPFAYEIPARDPVPDSQETASGLPLWMFWVMPFLVSLILFSLAYLVIAKGQPAIYNHVFFLFYMTSGLKSLGEAAAVLLVTSPGPQGVVEHGVALCGYVLIAIFLWFVLVFPRPIVPWFRQGRRGAVTLLLAVPFALNEFMGWVPAARAANLFNVYAVLVAITSLALLWVHSRETDSQEERSRIRWLSATFLILLLSTVVITVLHIMLSGAGDAGSADRTRSLAALTAVTILIAVPALEIVAAMILLYAILRYQVLGIDRIMVRITRGTVFALTVPSLFIVISNSIEQLFQVTVLKGVRFDFIIAGFVSSLLMFPVQKWITFLMHRIFPGFADDEAAEAQRRVEIFEAQLRYHLLDGALKPSEVDRLRRLATTIGLRDTELRSVAMRFPGIDVRDVRWTTVPG